MAGPRPTHDANHRTKRLQRLFSFWQRFFRIRIGFLAQSRIVRRKADLTRGNRLSTIAFEIQRKGCSGDWSQVLRRVMHFHCLIPRGPAHSSIWVGNAEVRAKAKEAIRASISRFSPRVPQQIGFGSPHLRGSVILSFRRVVYAVQIQSRSLVVVPQRPMGWKKQIESEKDK
jgi:hypothetical protein